MSSFVENFTEIEQIASEFPVGRSNKLKTPKKAIKLLNKRFKKRTEVKSLLSAKNIAIFIFILIIAYLIYKVLSN